MVRSKTSLGPALGLALVLSGCAAPAPPAPVSQRPAVQAPTRLQPAGLERVMGRTAAYLESEFGKADLDVREGNARKLQFIGGVCVLDAYLYPPAAGGEPIVTYVDARLPDGRDMDRASCAAAMTRREQAQ